MTDSRPAAFASFLQQWSPPDRAPEILDFLATRRGAEPARVVFASREIFRAATPRGELELRPSGRLRSTAELPVVGDWVAFRPASHDGPAPIEAVAPRRGALVRRDAGSDSRAQVLASGVETTFLVMGLDRDFNPRRFERLAILAREGGCRAIGVLTKRDLADDPVGSALDLRDVAPDVPVHTVDSLTGAGLEPLRPWLIPGETIALLGSSGAGKSTLINALCGEEIRKTGAVRASDGRGRHTTTERQLVRLPGGALLVDNPGIREVGLWAGEESVDGSFPEIEELAARCRFRDCTHESEPGCAVAEASDAGRLDPDRLDSWRRLRREVRSLEVRRDEATRRAADKRLGKLYKRIQAEKRGRNRT